MCGLAAWGMAGGVIVEEVPARLRLRCGEPAHVTRAGGRAREGGGNGFFGARETEPPRRAFEPPLPSFKDTLKSGNVVAVYASIHLR